MSNIRGLYDDTKEEDADAQRRRDANNRYVGGTDGRGGGRCVSGVFVFCLFYFLLLLLSINSTDRHVPGLAAG